jgi:hypothetical protein
MYTHISYYVQIDSFWMAVVFYFFVVFALKIVLSFIICHYDENHTLIYKQSAIIKYYLKTEFPYDLISTLPYEFLLQRNPNLYFDWQDYF